MASGCGGKQGIGIKELFEIGGKAVVFQGIEAFRQPDGMEQIGIRRPLRPFHPGPFSEFAVAFPELLALELQPCHDFREIDVFLQSFLEGFLLFDHGLDRLLEDGREVEGRPPFFHACMEFVGYADGDFLGQWNLLGMVEYVSMFLYVLNGGRPVKCRIEYEKTPSSGGIGRRGSCFVCKYPDQKAMEPGVLGKGTTSRMLETPVTSIRTRSNPRPNPLWGTEP